MFSKVAKLEKLLGQLAESVEKTDTRNYRASQTLQANGINLAEGATLTINMTNSILSLEIVNECISTISELKVLLPIRGERGLGETLNNYKNMLITRALEQSEGNKNKAADLLGITHRQIRYELGKQKELG